MPSSPAQADPAADSSDDGGGGGHESESDAKAQIQARAHPEPQTQHSHSQIQPPIQKRRRVTRACDECRRKKIKCDGKQPCTHCTVYSYDCTYDQPSNRRRNPAPQYIEALEQRLHKAEAILRKVLPNLDLDDPKFDAQAVDQLIQNATSPRSAHPPSESAPSRLSSTPAPTPIGTPASAPAHVSASASAMALATASAPLPQSSADDDSIQPMVDRVGSLVLDEQGNWDFHGHSSGFAFMRKFRSQFGEQYLPYPSSLRTLAMTQMVESPAPTHGSPLDSSNTPSSADLPPREVAIELCRNALDDCCALMRPIHRPTFFRRLHSIYDTEPDNYTSQQLKFLPVLYVVMGLGCLFSRPNDKASLLDHGGYVEAMEQGYQYFNSGKQMLNITDCRDLLTIQCVFFMIVFLQSSARLSTCYSYIGVGLRACCRLGLHRDLPNKFNPVETEERKRIFWIIRKMDSYMGALLGLPQMLSEDDVDQKLPEEVDDNYITEEGIKPMPDGVFPLIKASNAHTKLSSILRKVVRYVYPVKESAKLASGDYYTVSHAHIRELEQDLQAWMLDLPMQLRPSNNVGIELCRVQQLLRISYAHVQLMMYRPFILYVSQAAQRDRLDRRSFAYAAACVSVCRNIVHITSEMKKRGLLSGAYWFVIYTTYFAIVSLVYFVLENSTNSSSEEILKDALEGRDTLASLAARSLAADRCTASLASLFNELPEKLRARQSSTASAASSSSSAKKRQAYESPAPAPAPSRSQTMPHDFVSKIPKRNSMPDPLSLTMSNSRLPHLVGSGVGSPSPLGRHQSLSQPQPEPQPQPQPRAQSQPQSQFDFTSQIGGNEFKNMFSSDNPFAYPNHQPLSALESNDFGFGFDNLDSFPNSNNQSHTGTPPNTNGHISATLAPHSSVPVPIQFDNSHFAQLYEDDPGQQLLQQMSSSFPGGGIGAGTRPLFNTLQGLDPMEFTHSTPPAEAEDQADLLKQQQQQQQPWNLNLANDYPVQSHDMPPAPSEFEDDFWSQLSRNGGQPNSHANSQINGGGTPSMTVNGSGNVNEIGTGIGIGNGTRAGAGIKTGLFASGNGLSMSLDDLLVGGDPPWASPGTAGTASTASPAGTSRGAGHVGLS